MGCDFWPTLHSIEYKVLQKVHQAGINRPAFCCLLCVLCIAFYWPPWNAAIQKFLLLLLLGNFRLGTGDFAKGIQLTEEKWRERRRESEGERERGERELEKRRREETLGMWTCCESCCLLAAYLQLRNSYIVAVAHVANML